MRTLHDNRASLCRIVAVVVAVVSLAALSACKDSKSDVGDVDPPSDAASDTASTDDSPDSDANEDPNDGDEPSDGDEDAPVDSETDVDRDAAPDDVDAVADDDSPDTDVVVPAYRRDVDRAGDWPAPPGKRWVRSIVHLHSTHSHDACDGNPRIDGEYNLPCLESLRAALCATKIDVAYITDHPAHMVDVPFEDLLLFQPESDRIVTDELGRPYANVMPCDDGGSVTLRAGAEDRLMPVGLHEHVDEDPGIRRATMNAYDTDAVASMRSRGAWVWVAHTEHRTTAELRELGVDGIEVYQLHANIDPRIRESALGLDPFAPAAALFPFLTGVATTPPDLAVLAFLEPNEPSLRVWAELLQERTVVGTGGTDAHENVFPSTASDGERLDSYRRMMSWFSNYILVDADEGVEAGSLVDSIHGALGSGRVVIAFDILGSIRGFDVSVRDGDTRHELGETIDWREGLVLDAHIPELVGPSGLPANVRCAVVAAVDGEWTVVSTLPVGASQWPIAEPAIVRVSCTVTGEHLAPYLEAIPTAITREFPWIETNAFRVVAH